MHKLKVLLQFQAVFRVRASDQAEANRPVSALQRAEKDCEEHSEHVGTVNADDEVSNLEIVIHADNVERREGVAREQDQNLVGCIRTPVLSIPERLESVW